MTYTSSAQGVEGEPAGAAHPLLAGGAVIARRGRRRRLQDSRARRVPRRGAHPTSGRTLIIKLEVTAYWVCEGHFLFCCNPR